MNCKKLYIFILSTNLMKELNNGCLEKQHFNVPKTPEHFTF